MSDQQETLVSPETLAIWLADGSAALFDVREDHEWQQARIPGATLVPLSRFDPSSIQADGDQKIVLHCKSGVRCGQAAEILRATGDRRPLHRLQGGIINWVQSGQPVDRD